MAEYYVKPHPGYEEERMNPWILRIVLLGVAGLVLLFFTLVALLAAYLFMTQDQIYPGVAPVYGVEISGKTRGEALLALADQATYGDQSQFTFTYNGQEWTFTGKELGVDFDAQATINQAYTVGRDGHFLQNLIQQWRIWRDGFAVAPVITYNRTQAQTQLENLATQHIDRAVVEATLAVNGGQIQTTDSQTGLKVDLLATLTALEQEVLAMNTRSSIALVVLEEEPQIADATLAAEKVRQALDERGVTFYIPAEFGADAGPWIAQPVSIENMLRIERVENSDGSAYYDVFVTLEQAREFLNGLSGQLSRASKDARFIFNDDTRQLEVIESSVNGRQLNIERTLTSFSDAVFSDTDRTVPLIFDEVVPTINNNASAEELGITELITEATTTYIGSTAARRANIQVASARFHGVVIPPYTEFSFNDWLGEVNQDEGFEEAFIIVGDQTITGVGGGVCQVSTTVFQAAFYAGYPILERYAHGYRVEYYEVGEGVGMDAAIYTPILDFRFMNDTPHHLLIETYVRPASTEITFKFYSTSMGRRVVKEGPIIKNEQAPPPPVYRANPALQPGESIQTDYPVNGAEVFVYRTVYAADGAILIDKEQIYSNYVPWPAQFEVAPNDARLSGGGS